MSLSFFHRGLPLTPQVGVLPLIAPGSVRTPNHWRFLRGQGSARIAPAVEVAVAGAHNLLNAPVLRGPENRWWQNASPTIMPEPSLDEFLEVLNIHSARADTRRWPAFLCRPFRRRTIRFPTSGCSAGLHPRSGGRSPSRTTASFFWTNFRNSSALPRSDAATVGGRQVSISRSAGKVTLPCNSCWWPR